MPLNLAMSLLSDTEFVLWAVFAWQFRRKDLHRRFPVMWMYLLLRVVTTPLLLVLLFVQAQPWGKGFFPAYYFGFYVVYIASALLLFFVSIEVFRASLAAYQGLMRIGVVLFRWIVLVSIIVTLSTVSFAHRGILVIPDIANSLMRSVSILEMFVLAFLCLCMNGLRLPFRSMTFGIALGFGLMAANDFILASLISHFATLTQPLQFVYQSVVLGVLGVWIAYCMLPEPARAPLLVPVNSTIYRWNDIASALGQTGTQVALRQPANNFFLTDVERVVDKVLTRSLKSSDPE